MPRGKKTRQADQVKVIKAAIADPEASSRDIEKQTWIKKDTVIRIIDNVPEIVATSWDKGETIIEAIDKIINDVTQVTRWHLEQIKNKKEITTKDLKLLVDIKDSSFKHKQLLEWKPTDILWGVEMWEEQKRKIAQRYMKK